MKLIKFIRLILNKRVQFENRIWNPYLYGVDNKVNLMFRTVGIHRNDTCGFTDIYFVYWPNHYYHLFWWKKDFE